MDIIRYPWRDVQV